jgi:hypothetical protein
MHRLIMNPPAGKVVDHINRIRCDNRRDNLRVCDQAENLRNRRSFRGTSRFKGVHWNERAHKWVATICLNRKLIHLGYFDDELAAARAYDEKARELFGPFAYLNFPRRIVGTHGSTCSSACGRLRVRKLETRSTNLETNPNVQNPKCETGPRLSRAFRSLGHLDLGDCFGFPISCFEFPQSPPWPTGPPESGCAPRCRTDHHLFDKFISTSRDPVGRYG